MAVVEITQARRRRGRTSPQAIERAERERTAIALRIRGASFDEIAGQCGYADRSGARKAVERGLARHMHETVEEHRAIQLQRIELVISRLMPLIDREDPDLRAMDRLAKFMDQRAKLLALYSQPPQQPELPADYVDTNTVSQKFQDIEVIRRLTDKMMSGFLLSKYSPVCGFDVEDPDGDEPDAPFPADRTRPDALETALNANDEDDRPEDDDTEDEPPGEWRDGHFYPTEPLSDSIGPPEMDGADAAAIVRKAWSMD